MFLVSGARSNLKKWELMGGRPGVNAEEVGWGEALWHCSYPATHERMGAVLSCSSH